MAGNNPTRSETNMALPFLGKTDKNGEETSELRCRSHHKIGLRTDKDLEKAGPTLLDGKLSIKFPHDNTIGTGPDSHKVENVGNHIATNGKG